MWKTVKLGDVCTIKTGRKDVNEGNALGQYPFFTCAKEHTFSDGYSFDCEAILIAGNGAVGQTTYFKGKFEAYQRTYVLSEFEGIESKLLLFILQGKLMRHLSSMVLGNTIPYIKKGMLQDFEFSLPPLAEQQRIVAKLDAAFAEIDEAVLVASNKEKNADKLFKNYLSNIFQTNNQDWKSDNLENITSKIGSGATPRGGQASYKKDGISLIRSMNVHDMYFKYKNLAKIDNEQASKLSNVTVQENDILLNITGASVARCCLVERDVLPARVNQHVSIIRVNKEIVTPKFIVYGLISKPYKDKLLTVGNSGGATRQAITKTQIEDFIFYYPQSKEEQNNLITKLDSVYSHAQNLGEIYKKQIRQYVQLKSAILKQELQSSEAA